MVNEETRAQEMRRVMIREIIKPLHIRAEIFSPRGVINNHLNIEKDLALAERYFHTQAQSMAYFDDFSKLLGDECIMDIQRRRNNLPHILINMEYHTLEILRGALERGPLYRRVMQAKNI